LFWVLHSNFIMGSRTWYYPLSWTRFRQGGLWRLSFSVPGRTVVWNKSICWPMSRSDTIIHSCSIVLWTWPWLITCNYYSLRKNESTCQLVSWNYDMLQSTHSFQGPSMRFFFLFSCMSFFLLSLPMQLISTICSAFSTPTVSDLVVY
jgi:hypothetical protein